MLRATLGFSAITSCINCPPKKLLHINSQWIIMAYRGDIMKPFVSYKISGVQGDIISGDIRSFTVTDDLIETVEISQTHNTICGLKFTLKDTITFDSDVVAKVTNKAQVFFVNMYGKLQPSIRAFNLEVEQVYDPKQKQT